MNTEPGMVPWSYSSCSRTSRKVAGRADPRPPRARPHGCWPWPRGAGRGSWACVCSPRRTGKCYRRGRVFPTGRARTPKSGVRRGRRGRAAPCRGGRGHDVGGVVERCRLGVEDDEERPGVQGELGERGRRIDAERRADGEEHVGTLEPRAARAQVVGHEVLAERDGRRLQDAAALEARRIVLARAYARHRVLHRAVPAALQALHLVHRAVDLDDELGRRARSLVETVDVLRDQRVEVGLALELGEREVPGVGLSGVQFTVGAVAPDDAAVVGIGDVVLDRRTCVRPWGPWSRRPAARGSRGCPTRSRSPRR